jgi:hypothetical protein
MFLHAGLRGVARGRPLFSIRMPWDYAKSFGTWSDDWLQSAIRYCCSMCHHRDADLNWAAVLSMCRRGESGHDNNISCKED